MPLPPMEIWLSGPEQFFEKAKTVGILPWGDDEDQSHRISEPQKECYPQTFSAGLADVSPFFERSPHDPLPSDWRTKPLQCGVSIQVVEPTLSVGKILRHCKDRIRDGLCDVC